MSWRTKPVDDFPSRRETPWPIGFHRPDSHHSNDLPPDPKGLLLHRRPATALQAIMETAPGDQPQRSLEEDAPLADLLADVIEEMPERLKWVFQARNNRGMSFGQIAKELGLSKTHAFHLYGQATDWLQARLADEPLVTERLYGER